MQKKNIIFLVYVKHHANAFLLYERGKILSQTKQPLLRKRNLMFDHLFWKAGWTENFFSNSLYVYYHIMVLSFTSLLCPAITSTREMDDFILIIRKDGRKQYITDAIWFY